jgi:hypothetical protein
MKKESATVVKSVALSLNFFAAQLSLGGLVPALPLVAEESRSGASLPLLLEADFFRPEPLCFPPPSCLFTVAHARSSASVSDTPFSL